MLISRPPSAYPFRLQSLSRTAANRSPVRAAPAAVTPPRSAGDTAVAIPPPNAGPGPKNITFNLPPTPKSRARQGCACSDLLCSTAAATLLSGRNKAVTAAASRIPACRRADQTPVVHAVETTANSAPHHAGRRRTGLLPPGARPFPAALSRPDNPMGHNRRRSDGTADSRSPAGTCRDRASLSPTSSARGVAQRPPFPPPRFPFSA